MGHHPDFRFRQTSPLVMPGTQDVKLSPAWFTGVAPMVDSNARVAQGEPIDLRYNW